MSMGLTILVLEDEEALMKAVATKLESEGFKVLSSRSVDEGLAYINDGVQVDAIWLDHYLLGKRGGLEFVAELKKLKAGRELPIFVVSNTVSPDKIQEYIRLGVQKCFTKVDYRLEQIIGDIKAYFKSAGGQAPVSKRSNELMGVEGKIELDF